MLNGALADRLVPDDHLYIGTSASELLHFFRIPPDPSDPNGPPTFIFAFRLPVTSATPEVTGAPNGSRPGVQQILLLPRVGKACVLCNWTVTFYSLPELSPVFTQVRNCNWIGGVDLNESLSDDGAERSASVTILMSLNRRIQVVRIGEDDARVLRVRCFLLFLCGTGLTRLPENRLRGEHAVGAQRLDRMRGRFEELLVVRC